MDDSTRELLSGALAEVCAVPEAEGFLQPVNWKKLRLPDYPKTITSPMDLGTIKTKLADGKYSEARSVWLDVDLVWRNCRKFNHEESDIYRDCLVVQAVADALRRQKFPALAAEADAAALAERKFASATKLRAKVAYRICLLDSQHLGNAIRFLETQTSDGSAALSRSREGVAAELALDSLCDASVVVLGGLVKTLLRQQQQAALVGGSTA